MNSISFSYKGTEYLVELVTELEPDGGKRRIQITTQDSRVFELTFMESIFKWVISKSPLHER
jgi:hypothetical protein